MKSHNFLQELKKFLKLKKLIFLKKVAENSIFLLTVFMNSNFRPAYFHSPAEIRKQKQMKLWEIKYLNLTKKFALINDVRRIDKFRTMVSCEVSSSFVNKTIKKKWKCEIISFKKFKCKSGNAKGSPKEVMCNIFV